MKRTVLHLSLALFFLSCGTENTNKDELRLEGKTTEKIGKDLKNSIKKNKVLKVEEAYAKLIGNDSVKVIVEGVINDMCQKEGCWMTINFDDKNELIVFLDHNNTDFARNNPKGKSVIIEGYLYGEELSEETISILAEHIGIEGAHDFSGSKRILTLKASSFNLNNS